MKNFAATVGLSEINFAASGVPIGCKFHQSHAATRFSLNRVSQQRNDANSVHELK